MMYCHTWDDVSLVSSTILVFFPNISGKRNRYFFCKGMVNDGIGMFCLLKALSFLSHLATWLEIIN